MREIKFRGLNTKGEWVYGSLVTTDRFCMRIPQAHTKTWIVESAFGNGGRFNINKRSYVKPDTLGQFTGSKDQNCVDTYEGDILRDDPQSVLRVVSFSEGSFIAHDPKEPLDFVFLYDLDFEVIGSIHQNPELLNKA
ncbi:MAG: YopX family protein [Acidiferrobacterales bacterium]|nr:YopX family protein [Acidiferrobacterales bacterium]